MAFSIWCLVTGWSNEKDIRHDTSRRLVHGCKIALETGLQYQFSRWHWHRQHKRVVNFCKIVMQLESIQDLNLRLSIQNSTNLNLSTILATDKKINASCFHVMTDSSDAFTHLFHEFHKFFSVWAFGKEKKFFVGQKQFFVLTLPVEKDLFKKIVDS